MPGNGQGWAADVSVRLEEAADLQSLLDALARRYDLASAVVATSAGVVQAQVGDAVDDLAGLAAVIDTSVLPRYFSNGSLDAYADIPAPGLIALLVHARTSGEEKSELEQVSDYQVARQMTEELRAGMIRLAGM